MDYAKSVINMNRTNAMKMLQKAKMILAQMDMLENQIQENPEVAEEINSHFVKLEIDVMTGDAPEQAAGVLNMLQIFGDNKPNINFGEFGDYEEDEDNDF